MELLDPTWRCPLCFHEHLDQSREVCKRCLGKGHTMNRRASAFEYCGPASTLVRLMKYGNSPYISKVGGSFLLAQFLRLNWPKPDLIVPVPLSPLRGWVRGYNQSFLLAKIVAEGLGTPLSNCLTRSLFSLPQAALNVDERKKMSPDVFRLKNKINLQNKTILLIDDVLTTGTTLERCAELLRDENPFEIYVLALCQSFF